MDLQTSIKSYKNNVASKYDFLDASNLKQIGDQKYFCSKKFDGQTFFLSVQEDTIQILNSSFRDYSSNLQHIVDEVKNLKIKEKIIFVGELFDSSKERERNGDVIVGLSSKDQSSNLALALFDIAKQENTSHSFSDKYEKIKKLFGDDHTKPIFALSQQELELSEIQKFFDDCLQNGSEGIILRNDANIIKVKKGRILKTSFISKEIPLKIDFSPYSKISKPKKIYLTRVSISTITYKINKLNIRLISNSF